MRVLDRASLVALYALVLWVPLASGAYRGWPLAITELLTLAGLLLWVLSMARAGRLEWRRTALDLPLALLLALVLAQLALGNGALVAWALAPPAAEPDAPVAVPALLLLGTVSPAQTARSLRLFLTYAGVYVLVVNLVRTRARLDRLLRTLLVLGGVLSFFALLEYLTGEAWLLAWRDHAPAGRLTGTFVNPDHFAAWLEMLICLGIGSVLARSRPGAADRSPGALLGSREGRERLIRRYLPMVGVGVMTLALLFTLSRGGVVSLLFALVALLSVEGTRGRARRSLVLVGVLLALTIGYGAWIGLGPLLDRLRSDEYGGRFAQLLSTLAMLRAFPLVGVGLGAYRDIYPRYQPPELLPGKVYLPFAHNDLLQLAVEMGLVGTSICAFAAWRVGADLVAAHLLGRGRCPVGGGEEEGARRSEAGSVGIGLGAASAVLALVAHSAFDFGARIPANGVLAAACLGIATVALHTRFGGADRLLTATRALTLGAGWRGPAAVIAGAAILALAAIPPIVRAPLVESRLEAAGPAAAGVEQALALAPRDAEARWARARQRLARARQVWDSGLMADGRVLTSWAERRREALPLFDGAIADLEVALSARPSDPYLHEALGWAHGGRAAIDEGDPRARQARAVTALRRAIALQPENPYLHRSLAALALGQREPLVAVALSAARGAIARDPSLLAELVDRLLPLGLGEAQWAEMVPDSAVDRLELAALLDKAGLGSAAEDEYRRAVALLPPGADALARWALARALVRRGDLSAALIELDTALRSDPDNPELHLARAEALAAGRDARALDAYRTALARAEARAARPGADPLPFRADDRRARALADRALGEDGRGVVRYRRALAEFLDERKLWAQAAREWEEVLAIAPLDARAHFFRARALGGAGKPTEALEEYRRAVALDGRAVPFRMALAQSLWESEQYYQAMNEWHAALSADPGNVQARLALGHAYLATGDRLGAWREYQRVLQLAPDNLEARRGLGRVGQVPRG
jgi:tetratricopeptide (TPR) repeat protein